MRLFCTICTDSYFPGSEVHVTNCGHLYHGSCISTWFKTNKTCPQCRASVSQSFRVYFDVEKGEETDRVTLERHLEVLMNRLHESAKCKKNLLDEKKKLLNEKQNLLDEKKNLLDEKKNFEKSIMDMKECVESLTNQNDLLSVSLKFWKEELKKSLRKNDCMSSLQSEVESLKAKLSILERVETLIKGSAEEVNKLIESTPVTTLSVKRLCTYVGILKDRLKKVEERNVELMVENSDISKALAEEKEKPFKEKGVEELINSLRDKNKELENELSAANESLNHYKRKYLNRVKSLAPLKQSPYQDPSKRNVVDLSMESFLEEEKKNAEVADGVEQNRTEAVHTDKAIARWVELVTAGPIQYLGLSKTRSFGTALHDKDNNGASGSSISYAFDGERKRIKLGGPTPAEEFEKIKQKKAKKGLQASPRKKLIDYLQLD